MRSLRPVARHLAGSLVSLAALLSFVPSRAAEACGGTFCDNLPDPMPVDQTGEDILFVQDGPEVEVHVRIAYEGEAERFAWIVPLHGVPTVSVGSEALFVALGEATAPRWRTQRSYECEEDEPGFDDDGGIKLDLGGDESGGPDVVFEDVVGSFEVVVLQGGTAAEVIDFLQANNYAQDPESEPILQEYLDEGFLFAAVKLAAGVDVEAIHPLVFRFQGDEPCVPIRLTRIAAKQDMGIRAYFLGQDRWAPTNYAHVVLNPLRYDWLTTSGYAGLLTMAVDEADGRAFVTEYAGSSGAVQTESVWSPQWDEAPFVTADPIQTIDLIGAQGLNQHPLIQPLLLEFLPPPEGIEATDYWNNIEQYIDQIDLDAWDGAAFAAALAERIIDPGQNAVDLLDAWPKLTRLNTTMSPAEMTVDPMFHANPDLPDVEPVVTSSSQVLCGGGDELVQVDVGGTTTPVCVPEDTSWPEIDAMPYALRIEQIPMTGPPQVVIDNQAAALELLAAQQATVECLSEMGGDTTEGEDGSFIGGDETSETSPTYDLPYDTTCGCATARGEAPLAIALGLLVLGLIRPRRRTSTRRAQ